MGEEVASRSTVVSSELVVPAYLFGIVIVVSPYPFDTSRPAAGALGEPRIDIRLRDVLQPFPARDQLYIHRRVLASVRQLVPPGVGKVANMEKGRQCAKHMGIGEAP